MTGPALLLNATTSAFEGSMALRAAMTRLRSHLDGPIDEDVRTFCARRLDELVDEFEHRRSVGKVRGAGWLRNALRRGHRQCSCQEGHETISQFEQSGIEAFDAAWLEATGQDWPQ